jgi:hypothetical protein
MFQPQLFDKVPLVEHLHADGTSSPMEIEPVPDDAAEHDPERTWAGGRIYRCTRCDERVKVTFPPVEGLPEEG